ncbi:bestrophin family protein [Massilia niastensis]|uniref:bestrophin family protein n=1 Tax=Massilia niastensis TaxID=544911 RepID=UPI000373E545|nr:bestrophin family ion channel [Massilia niastensis]
MNLLFWTRRKAYLMLALASIPVLAYQLLDWHWIAIPWPVIAMLGTAASFIVGFKNVQTYNRTVEALQVWGSIGGASRYWGLICRDFTGDLDKARELVHRHLAWLTALRYDLRRERVWEGATRRPGFEYLGSGYQLPEQRTTLEQELSRFLPEGDPLRQARCSNLALMLLAEQSREIKALFAAGTIPVLHHAEMQKTLKDLVDQQGRAERLKNFPYPRQYAIIDTVFVWAFALLLPYGLVKEFAQLNLGGLMAGQTAWLAVPFSVLISWMYVSLDQVGESTENPFEGGLNDVPISYMSHIIETELRELLGERDLPPPPEPRNHIIL